MECVTRKETDLSVMSGLPYTATICFGDRTANADGSDVYFCVVSS